MTRPRRTRTRSSSPPVLWSQGSGAIRDLRFEMTIVNADGILRLRRFELLPLL